MEQLKESSGAKKIKNLFKNFLTPQEKYEKIIELGQSLPPFPIDEKQEKNLVEGCQSLLYLHVLVKDGCLYFNADSEALISKGLAAILIEVYSGLPPSSLFQISPLFLKELGLYQALSPARSNGVLSVFKTMQAKALDVMKQMASHAD